MKFTTTDQLLSGYFLGRISLAAFRFFFTSRGMVVSFIFLLWAFTQPGIKEDQYKNWSSKDLRYLKNNEISLQEKCKRRKVSSQAGKRVQKLMCSPVERWHTRREDALLISLKNSEISFDEFAEKNRELKSEFFKKRRQEKENPDHPSIMESNLKSPRPIYTKDLGFTMP